MYPLFEETKLEPNNRTGNLISLKPSSRKLINNSPVMNLGGFNLFHIHKIVQITQIRDQPLMRPETKLRHRISPPLISHLCLPKREAKSKTKQLESPA